MMDKYYYLVATLPTLEFGIEPGITVDGFMDEAVKWMDGHDLSVIRSLDLQTVSVDKRDPRHLKAYKQFEHEMRTDIAAWRDAQKRDLDYKPASFPITMIKEGNPLEVELKFMERRWQFLNEMEREHHFDFTFVVIYYLKLLLLQRYFEFDNEKGLDKFQKLYQEVTA